MRAGCSPSSGPLPPLLHCNPCPSAALPHLPPPAALLRKSDEEWPPLSSYTTLTSLGAPRRHACCSHWGASHSRYARATLTSGTDAEACAAGRGRQAPPVGRMQPPCGPSSLPWPSAQPHPRPHATALRPAALAPSAQRPVPSLVPPEPQTLPRGCQEGPLKQGSHEACARRMVRPGH